MNRLDGCVYTKSNLLSLAPLMLAVLCLSTSQVSFIFSSESPITPQNTSIIDEEATITSDLLLDGNSSLMVENCSLDIEGRVVISGGSRLVLRNTKMRLMGSGQADPRVSYYWFDVQGNSSLEAVNVTIETAYFQGFRIMVSDSAKLSFRGVYSMDWYGLTCSGGATVAVEDSTCWSTFNMGDNSAIIISGSRVYGVNVTDCAKAYLDGVYATTASVSDDGYLHIQNSTISSETTGLLLGFDEGTELALTGFPASPTGIDYWHCDSWSLREEYVTGLNLTLNDVYFRNVRLDVGQGADIEVIDVDAPLEIECSSEALTVIDSTIDGVRLKSGCALSAEEVSLSWLEAWTESSATLSGSIVQRSVSHNSSVISYSSSSVDSLSCNEEAVVLMCGSSLPEDLLVEGYSAVVYFSQPVSAALLGYDLEEGVLDVGLERVQGDAELTVVLDRDRVRRRSELGVLLNDELVDYRVVDEKDLSFLSSRLSLGVDRLTVVLGAPPSERVPFLETLLGQRLVTLLLILLLVIFVLLTWR